MPGERAGHSSFQVYRTGSDMAGRRLSIRGPRKSSSHEGKEGDLRKRLLSDVSRQCESVKAALSSARAIAASVHEDERTRDTRLEEVAQALDVLVDSIASLERSVDDTVSAALEMGSALAQPQAAAGAKSPRPPQPAPPPPTAQVQGAPKDDTPQSKLLCAMYIVLEALTWQTKAERGTVLLYTGQKSDELQSIAMVGSHGIRTNQLRVPASLGVAGAVFGTGIAVNQTHNAGERIVDVSEGSKDGKGATPFPNPPSHPAGKGQGVKNQFRTKGMLCFPIPSPSSPEIIGVVQLLNKCRGADNFTNDDEHLLWSGSRILSYILKRYPVDWCDHQFDPSPLHSIVPWEPQASSSKILPAGIAKHESCQLVYRTSQSGQYIRHRQLRCDKEQEGAPIGASASLKEVDAYIQNLEECWRRSVGMNIEYERDNDDKQCQMRGMREEVRHKKKAIRQLQDQMRLQNLEFDSYKQQYESIKEELKQLLDAKNARSRPPPVVPVVGQRKGNSASTHSNVSEDDDDDFVQGLSLLGIG